MRIIKYFSENDVIIFDLLSPISELEMKYHETRVIAAFNEMSVDFHILTFFLIKIC